MIKTVPPGTVICAWRDMFFPSFDQALQDILVEDCGLYGCGTVGVMGESSKNMQIVNNDIYECSVAGVEFSNCDDVNVDGCTIRDIGTPEYDR